jgi:hypothetical protein
VDSGASYSARVDWRCGIAWNSGEGDAAVGCSVTRNASRLASKPGSALSPCANAAWARFSATQPNETKRWWSSESTAGQRRVRSNRIVMACSYKPNFQHCMLWLDGANVA